VKRPGESRLRVWMGMSDGRTRDSGWPRSIESLTEEVSSDERGGDQSMVRRGVSFFFRLSACRSAAV
jgi:hypothetical protein